MRLAKKQFAKRNALATHLPMIILVKVRVSYAVIVRTLTVKNLSVKTNVNVGQHRPLRTNARAYVPIAVSARTQIAKKQFAKTSATVKHRPLRTNARAYAPIVVSARTQTAKKKIAKISAKVTR